MGRAARNHRGTGGHGYFPSHGERPNYNQHIISDQALLDLVTTKIGEMQVGSGDKQKTSSVQLYKQKMSSVQLIRPRKDLSEKQNDDRFPVTSGRQPGIQFKDQVISPEQEQQTLISDQLLVTKSQSSSAKQHVTSVIQPVTSVLQPEISAKQP